MANRRASGVMRQVARVVRDGTLAGLPDREVLRRFVDARDEAAFEALLARHGPMVRNVCRQVLRDPDDVDDAFQVVFLALADRARALHVDESLGPWLYTVANRVAARARADRRRRSIREWTGGPIPEPEPGRGDGPGPDEVARVVHEELGRLPERLRAPIVLCDLEGMTHDRAAQQLGCPVGTVHSRLARARARLRERITRRGLLATTAAIGAVLALDSRASAVPPLLYSSLARSAARVAAGAASLRDGCVLSARVVALMEGVLNVSRIERVVGSLAGLAAAGIVAAVAGLSVFSAFGQTGDPVEVRKPGGVGGHVKAEPHQTIVKTYYIGDLILPDGRLRETLKRSADGVSTDSQPRVDMSPVVEIIASNVRPGTWTVHDDRGGAGSGAQTDGHITPFYLSYSLIIRHTDVAHAEVADLLRKLRRLVYARNNPNGARGYDREVEKVGLPAPTGSGKPAQVAPPSPPDRQARIRRLLDELRQEIDRLPRD